MLPTIGLNDGRLISAKVAARPIGGIGPTSFWVKMESSLPKLFFYFLFFHR